MRWDPRASWAPRLAAAGLTLLVAVLVITGIGCLSVTRTQCSVASLLHGRRDLDVPYAGTRPAVVDRMLEAARVGASDHVIDLGTGDGRILIAAARDRGARGLGVDIDPALIDEARRNARRAGVEDRVRFRVENLFETPLSDATVVTLYLLPEVNLRLRPRLLAQLRPGARIVSHSFDMGEWRPDESHRVGGARIHMWTVPARVEGNWRFTDEAGRSGELRIAQHFQTFTGELRLESRDLPIVRSRMAGDRIDFEVATPVEGRSYAGRVRGDRITPLDPSHGWHAERLEEEVPRQVR
jgi:hypothetical protein